MLSLLSLQCIYICIDDSPTSAQGQGFQKLVWLLRNSDKMLVLAGIYAAMNILSFVAFAGIFLHFISFISIHHVVRMLMYMNASLFVCMYTYVLTS